MTDGAPPELTGKGKRVAGVFVFMIGASIILDTHAVWIGLPILAAGVGLFAWGIAVARDPLPATDAVRGATTESPP